ncbi:unnamed protein product, partial [Didymodactylos carnosus]
HQIYALSSSYNNSSVEIMHVTCGTDLSWYRKNTNHSRPSYISIGDILFREYAERGRFYLTSTKSLSPECSLNNNNDERNVCSVLSITNIMHEDHGVYTCKHSNSQIRRTVKLIVNSQPYVHPKHIIVYPVNRTFSLTCSLLCEQSKDNIGTLLPMHWLFNGQLVHNILPNDHINIELLSYNTQRLTVYLNGQKRTRTIDDKITGNYTCQYKTSQTTVHVQRRTSIKASKDLSLRKQSLIPPLLTDGGR